MPSKSSFVTLSKLALSAAAFASALANAQSDKPATPNPAQTDAPPAASAPAPDASKNDAYYSAGPGSATLPTGVFRFKTGPIEGFGSKGRDGKGKVVDHGISADGWGAGWALAYGITDSISMEISSGFALTNKVGIDKNQFRKSSLYKDNYNAFLNTAAGVLAANAGGPCQTKAACIAFIEAGGSLSDDTDMSLPTNEKLRVRKGVPLKAYADSLVLNGAKGAEGETGLQDIDVGLIWNAYKDDNFGFAVGGGVRLPTGKFTDVPSGKRGTGSGTFDLGLKLVGDAKVLDGLWLGFDNQMEWNLMKVKRKKTSLLDNTQTLSTTEEVERWGTKHKGSAKISWGAGTIDQSLKWLGVSILPLKWEFNQITVIDGKPVGAPAELTEAEFGFTLDGFAVGLPLQLYTYYVLPTWGQNLTASLSWAGTTLSAFYKF